MGSFQTRAQTRVPCIGRWIPNHCATREAPHQTFDVPNYLFILVCAHGSLWYSVSYDPLLSLFIFMLKLSSVWPVRIPWSMLLYPSVMFPLFLNAFLFSGAIICFSFIFYFCCLKSGISHFSKGTLVPFSLRIVFRSQDLGTKCVHCNWVVTVPRLFLRIELGDYMYVNIYIHAHIYFYIFFFISIY